MARPVDARPADVHVDPDLTSMAIDWPVPQLIGEQIAPFTPVETVPSAKYWTFGRAEERITPAKRGVSDTSRSVEIAMSTDTYVIDDYALNLPVADKTRQAATGAAPKALAQGRLTKKLKTDVMLNHEYQVNALMATSSNYLGTGGPNSTGLYENMDTLATHNFDDTNVNGVDVILAYMDAVEEASGLRPDTLVISADCYRKMRTDPNFKGNATAQVLLTREQIAELFEVDKIIIARTLYNTAKKGQNPTLARLWTSNCIWGLITGAQADPMWPSTFKTFTGNLLPYMNEGEAVRTWRDEKAGGGTDFVEYARAWGLKTTGKDENSKIITGFFLQNAYIAL